MSTLLKPGMIEPGFATTEEITALRSVFVGMEADFPFLPSDPWWIPEFGQLLLVADYPVLFARIGTQYGGDGVTNFRLPDKRGRVTAGVDNMGGVSANRLTGQAGGLDGDVLGAVGGAETVALTLAQMPAHKHDVSLNSGGAHKHNFARGTTGGGAGAQTGPAGAVDLETTTDGAHTHTVNETTKGSGTAHNNVQPTIVSYRCILAY